MADETKLCSKCKKNQVAFPDSSNPWCAECRAEAQKKYLESKDGQTEGKGFARGVSAMRENLIGQFLRFPVGQFSGQDVARLIKGAIAPTLDQQSDG